MEATKKTKNISEHISYHEATHSNHAKRNNIKNEPNKQQVKNMVLLAEKVFEPLREWVGKPIKINSMFRSKELNRSLGGSFTSSHLDGNAFDITNMGGKTNKEIFDWVRAHLDYDQIIWEYGKHEPQWLHISYNKGKNRKQALITRKKGLYHFYTE
jgi:zinc D-Ala-D-Ala carboxypeptidase